MDSKNLKNFSYFEQMAQIVDQIQKAYTARNAAKRGFRKERREIGYKWGYNPVADMCMHDSDMKKVVLQILVMDADYCINIAIYDQNDNLNFIKTQSETDFYYIKRGGRGRCKEEKLDDIWKNFIEISASVLVEVMAYQLMGKDGSARTVIQSYAEYLEKEYLNNSGVTERLDALDTVDNGFWTKTLLDIKNTLQQMLNEHTSGK